MSDDIKLARIENYLQAKAKGLHAIIDGTFEGIRAQLLEHWGPSVPAGDEDLRRPAGVHILKTWPDLTREQIEALATGRARHAASADVSWLPPGSAGWQDEVCHIGNSFDIIRALATEVLALRAALEEARPHVAFAHQYDLDFSRENAPKSGEALAVLDAAPKGPDHA